MDTEKLKQFVELANEKAEMKLRSSQISSAMRHLERDILAEMADEEIPRITTHGKTFSILIGWSAKFVGPDREAAAQALEDAGLEYLVKVKDFNLSSVSKYVNEHDGEIPDELEEYFEPNQYNKLGMQKAR
jgi:hypothetical protein